MNTATLKYTYKYFYFEAAKQQLVYSDTYIVSVFYLIISLTLKENYKIFYIEGNITKNRVVIFFFFLNLDLFVLDLFFSFQKV